MSWLLTKLRGVYLVMVNGEALPEVPTLNIVSSAGGSAGVVYNAPLNRIDITIPFGAVPADPDTYVIRDGDGNIEGENVTAISSLAGAGLGVTGDATIGGGLSVGTSIGNALTGLPTSGFIRWAATGLHGIWAKSLAAATVKLFDFDPTTAAISVGNDANAPVVELRAGPSGLVNVYVDGSLRLSISKTGIGMNGKSPTVSPFTVSGSRGSATVAVLTSLLTALDGSGILVDSTSP